MSVVEDAKALVDQAQRVATELEQAVTPSAGLFVSSVTVNYSDGSFKTVSFVEDARDDAPDPAPVPSDPTNSVPQE